MGGTDGTSMGNLEIERMVDRSKMGGFPPLRRGWTFMRRVRIPEWMDDPALDPAEHRLALRGLVRVNAVSYTGLQTWNAIKRVVGDLGPEKTLSVCELASGGGEILEYWSMRARREAIASRFYATDYNPRTVEGLTQSLTRKGHPVEARVLDVLGNTPYPDCDISVCTLFMHHLDPEDVIKVLTRMAASARKGIVVSDLRRSWSGWALAWGVGRILSRSRVVHHDGPVSVQAAYTVQEILDLGREAGLVGLSVRRSWPQRWLLEWRRNS